jgi:hypothetical protein
MDHGPWTDKAQPNLVYGLWFMVYFDYDYEHEYDDDDWKGCLLMSDFKTLFACRFYRSVARRIIQRIEDSNGGYWPEMRTSQWEAAARAFDIPVLRVPLRDFGGAYDPRDNTIYVPKFASEERVCQIIAHEIAEALVRRGAADGEDLLDWPNDREEFHLTASHVEQRAAAPEGRPLPEWMTVGEG